MDISKDTRNTKIPKIIFQSWKTKKLDSKMESNVKKLREQNPEYEYFLFDDEDCKTFLLEYFGKNYVDAFEILIPGAFKCDLWRYAVLYIYGGVYIDIDMIPLVPLRELIPETASFVSVVDHTWVGIPGIFQAFLACDPGNEIVKKSLELAFYNIASRRNGLVDVLCITGPGVVYSLKFILEK